MGLSPKVKIKSYQQQQVKTEASTRWGVAFLYVEVGPGLLTSPRPWKGESRKGTTVQPDSS